MRAASIGFVVFMPRLNSGQLVVGGERDKLDGNIRDYAAIWLEAVAQPIEIRQNAGVKTGVDCMREIGFTGAVMRERKQADHGAAGLLLALLGQERLECAGISAAREQLIAVD